MEEQKEILNPEQEKLLEKLYYRDKNFFGSRRLYYLAKDIDINITRRKVEFWLSKQRVNQLTRNRQKNFHTKNIISKGPNIHYQMDLMDMNKFSKENFNIKFLLSMIDIYTKKAYIFKLYNKEPVSVLFGINKLLKNKFGKNPHILQSDNGSEFKNDLVKNYLKKEGIKAIYSTPFSPTSQGVVEKFNGTIKKMIFKYFIMNNTVKYINILDKLIENYNSSWNWSTKQKPNDKKEKTTKIDEQLQENTKKSSIGATRYKKLHIGDRVRVYLRNPKTEGTIKEKFVKKWSEEVYKIARIVHTKNPLGQNRYKIRSKNIIGEGIFERWELLNIE